MPRRIQILGVPVDLLTHEEILRQIEKFISDKRPHQIATLNAEFLVAAQKDHEFRELLHQTTINTADGIGLLWAAKFLSLRAGTFKMLQKIRIFWQLLYTTLSVVFHPEYIRSVVPEKISGTDLIWSISYLAQKNGYTIFILGGFGDTPERTAQALHARYPNLKIVGTSSSNPDENGVIEMINQAKPNILFLAYGPVRQEKWLAKNLQKLAISVGIGLGGTFDYIAGKRPFAPNFLRYRGLEWAYRLFTQPKRLFRIANAVPIFMNLVYRSKLAQFKPYRQNVAACVINENNHILICRRKHLGRDSFITKNHWQLPQGGINDGESTEQALSREIFEETGIRNLKILGSLPQAYVYDWPVSVSEELHSGKYRGQQQSIFFLRTDTRKAVPKLDNREFDAYQWVPVEKLVDAVSSFRKPLAQMITDNIEKFAKIM